MSKHHIPKGLLAGKVTKGHKTVIPAATEFLLYAKRLPSVTKIALGVIKSCPPAPTRFKLVKEQHAIRVQVRGTGAVQTLFVYSDDVDATLQELERFK